MFIILNLETSGTYYKYKPNSIATNLVRDYT